MPVKRGGATPTIVNARPFSMIVVPTVAGSAPKARRHSASPMTAAGGAEGSVSAAMIPRPFDGVTPSASKYSPVTRATRTRWKSSPSRSVAVAESSSAASVANAVVADLNER